MDERVNNIVEQTVRQYGNNKHIVIGLKKEVINPRFDNRQKFYEMFTENSIVSLQKEDMPISMRYEEYYVDGFNIAYTEEGSKHPFRMTIYLDKDTQALVDAIVEIKHTNCANKLGQLKYELYVANNELEKIKRKWYRKLYDWFDKKVTTFTWKVKRIWTQL